MSRTFSISRSPLRRLIFAAVLSAAVLPGTSLGAAAAGTFGTADVPSVGDMVVGPDGSIYGSDLGNGRIYRISPSGAVTVFAGAGDGAVVNGYTGDGGPAVDAQFRGIVGLAWAA